jgi:hypothetical protein
VPERLHPSKAKGDAKGSRIVFRDLYAPELIFAKGELD